MHRVESSCKNEQQGALQQALESLANSGSIALSPD